MNHKEHERLSALICVVTIGLVLWALAHEFRLVGFRGTLLFTTHSNLYIALLCLHRLFSHTYSRLTAIATGIGLLAIAATGIVYTCFIYPVWLYWGTAFYSISRCVTHLVVQSLFIGNWIFFWDHGKIRWRDIGIWFLYPLLYGSIFLYLAWKRGLVIYSFFSTAYGPQYLAIQLAKVLFLFLLAATILVLVDQKLGDSRDALTEAAG